MKVKVSKHISKDAFYTLAPANFLLKFFNLSCIYRKDNILKVSWSLTKSVIYIFGLGIINVFILFIKLPILDYNEGGSPITFANAIPMFYFFGYAEYIVDTYFVYRHGNDSYINYFKLYDNLDQMLGITDYDHIRKIIKKSVVFSVVIFVFSSIFDCLSWSEGFDWSSWIMFSTDYLYFFLNMLTVFDGLSHVIQVEYRLEFMKDLLENYYNSPQSNKTISSSSLATYKSTSNNNLDSLKTLSHDRFIEVIGFSRCYLFLLEQCKYINSMFGARVLVFCINLLLNIITLLNLIVRVINGTLETPNGRTFLPSLSSLLMMLNWAITAIIIVYRCERSYKQSEMILEVIDLMLVNKKNSENLTTTLTELRNLLLTRPIRFHAINFFTVDYTLLVSFSSVVVTYTIIMLQSMK